MAKRLTFINPAVYSIGLYKNGPYSHNGALYAVSTDIVYGSGALLPLHVSKSLDPFGTWYFQDDGNHPYGGKTTGTSIPYPNSVGMHRENNLIHLVHYDPTIAPGAIFLDGVYPTTAIMWNLVYSTFDMDTDSWNVNVRTSTVFSDENIFLFEDKIIYRHVWKEQWPEYPPPYERIAGHALFYMTTNFESPSRISPEIFDEKKPEVRWVLKDNSGQIIIFYGIADDPDPYPNTDPVNLYVKIFGTSQDHFLGRFEALYYGLGLATSGRPTKYTYNNESWVVIPAYSGYDSDIVINLIHINTTQLLGGNLVTRTNILGKTNIYVPGIDGASCFNDQFGNVLIIWSELVSLSTSHTKIYTSQYDPNLNVWSSPLLWFDSPSSALNDCVPELLTNVRYSWAPVIYGGSGSVGGLHFVWEPNPDIADSMEMSDSIELPTQPINIIIADAMLLLDNVQITSPTGVPCPIVIVSSEYCEDWKTYSDGEDPSGSCEESWVESGKDCP